MAEGRKETDASLGTERATADATVARVAAKAQRQLDALISRDRVLADRRVTMFRRNADEVLAGARDASPAPSAQVVEERIAADGSKRAERSLADAVLERERRGADARDDSRRGRRAVAQAGWEAQRKETNERLSHERSDADAIADERDVSVSALDVARSVATQRSDVFAMVTHDLRNPLTVIVANAEFLAEHAEDDDTREAAQEVTQATARMGRLLTDLLDVARIDAGWFPVAKRPCDVRGLLSEVRHAYHPLFKSRGVTLAIDVPQGDVVASIDHDRIVQMLSNLLGNALKFTHSGGRVDLQLEHGDEGLVFRVRDDGDGIDPDALPHIFERFWQRDRDTRRGLGLGLYLCRTIALAHGGDISVRSELGAGTTFSVDLPAS